MNILSTNTVTELYAVLRKITTVRLNCKIKLTNTLAIVSLGPGSGNFDQVNPQSFKKLDPDPTSTI